MAKKVLKSEADRRRERAYAAIRRMEAKRGDRRTEAEIIADVDRHFHYTPEEAARLIASIEADSHDCVPTEDGDGGVYLWPKEDMIEHIRKMTR